MEAVNVAMGEQIMHPGGFLLHDMHPVRCLMDSHLKAVQSSTQTLTSERVPMSFALADNEEKSKTSPGAVHL